MFDFMPTDDLKSYAIRLAHYGVIGGLLGLAIAILLLLQNVYLLFAVVRIRGQLHMVLRRLEKREGER